MSARAERIRGWAAQVRAGDRAATIEQCLDAIDLLLAEQRERERPEDPR